MAYDSNRGRSVLFTSGDNTTPSRTWEYDGVTWTDRAPVVAPSGRFSAAMAFDAARGVVVLFGGRNGVQNPLPAETWEWDGAIWTQRFPTIAPPPRAKPVMAFDSFNARVVLHGGSNASGSLNDTWTWDGSRWTNHLLSAPPNSMQAMTYDAGRRRVVAWFYGSGLREWINFTWASPPQTGSIPPGLLESCQLAYHPTRGTTILFGGINVQNGSYPITTWEWNGASWTVVPATALGRQLHRMVYDSVRDRIVTVGGVQGSVVRGCNELATNPVTPVAAPFGTGCGTGPLALAPYNGNTPVLGFPFRTVVSPVATTMPFVALGFSDTQFGPAPLPIPLDSFGATGCVLLQSAEIHDLACQPASTGTARNTINLPNSPGLAGAVVFLQAWLSAPGQNAAGIVLSNGLRVTIGD